MACRWSNTLPIRKIWRCRWVVVGIAEWRVMDALSSRCALLGWCGVGQ